MESKRGYFISIEGIEGSGKSTLIAFLKEWLTSQHVNYVMTREPGGTPIAEEIRRVLLNHHEEPMSADTELLLMFAGRAQNIARVIKPALAAGQWVLSDRFTDASFAYQGGGRGAPLKHIKDLAEWVQGPLWPDLTILLDVPVEVGLSRIHSRGAKDRIEQEGIHFFERVRQMYLTLAQDNPSRIRVISGEQSPEAVQNAVKSILMPWIG